MGNVLRRDKNLSEIEGVAFKKLHPEIVQETFFVTDHMFDLIVLPLYSSHVRF